MVKSCLICENKYFKGSPYSFHSFPKSQSERKLWCKNLNIPEEVLDQSSYLCSRHFNNSLFVTCSGNKSYMTQNAAPSLSANLTDSPPTLRVSSSEEDEGKDYCTAFSSTIRSSSGSINNSRPTVSLAGESLVNLVYSSMGSTIRSIDERTDSASFVNSSSQKSTACVASIGNSTSERDIESGDSSSTLTASETEEILMQMPYNDIKLLKSDFNGRLALINRPQRSRKRRYAGDLTIDDFDTPEDALESYRVLNKTMLSQKQKIQDLQATVEYLRKRIKDLNGEIAIEKKKSLKVDKRGESKRKKRKAANLAQGNIVIGVEKLLEDPSVLRPELTTLPKSKPSSERGSTTHMMEQMETHKIFPPSNSIVKCEEIDIGETKVGRIDPAHDYCIPTGERLRILYEDIKTEYIDPLESESARETLHEANEITEINIKSEDIEVGEIKLENMDCTQDYLFETSQCLKSSYDIEKEYVNPIKHEIEDDSLEVIEELNQVNDKFCRKTEHQSMPPPPPPLHYYNVSHSNYIDYETEIDNLTKVVRENKR